jgi:beta propeller repeat protein
MYDISTGVETAITTDSGEQWDPYINGDRIVWLDLRNGGSDVYMYDLFTGEETAITMFSGSAQPSIYGDKIVWWDRNGGVYLFALKSISINLAPDQPIELSQLKSDGTTQITVGGATAERTVVFSARVSDPDGDKVRLQVELRVIAQ